MSEYVLRTLGLTKKFGAVTVVNTLNLNVRKGDIYGFIGPNGAGKTTVMKVVLGLLKANAGEVELFGKTDNRSSLRKVGSLIESPGLYTESTAWENMKRFSILCGGTDADIQQLLGAVGLAEVGNKRVKTFSLGMKQRLGIAIALLGRPELMVLDEPVNGLDPMGMKAMRDLIQYINREMGVTFFISSHLLGELEKISTVYGIINRGVLIEEITASELEKRCTKSLKIRCSDPKAAADIICTKFGPSQYQISDDMLDIVFDINRSATVNKVLVESGIWVSELGMNTVSYEDYFLTRMGTMDVGKGVGQYA